ncbi:MAG TPA: glycosyltransferase family 2 protein [Albitalea sp.]|uniref:glycosyltransferase family 2 protein n=1 Tax=Piscinibacter sp. TaxID=1903157 RepID=UPI002ED67464
MALAVLTVALTLAAAVLLAAAAVLLLQVLLSFLPERAATPHAERPRLAVLMPAHDEAAGIADTLASVRPQLQPGDRLLVVADNCSDDTAQVAARCGAEVAQRRDDQRRGKGYALDFGMRRLEADPPALVVFVDADCALEPGALDRLARDCARHQRPVQALYLMQSPPDAGLKTRIAELAWLVKNQVRPLGWHRAGLPCQLMGTGMAFPWAQIRGAPLASGHLVEDMQLGLDLALAGAPPRFCPGARVTSLFPAQAQGLASQRLRWEHGHLGVIASRVPRLLWHAIAHGRPQLAAMALDVGVPPLAALALMLLVAMLAGALFAALGGGALPLALAGLGLAALLLAVLLAWSRHGRHIVSLGELLGAPLYVLGKIPVYTRLFKGRQVEWVRTHRDDKPH